MFDDEIRLEVDGFAIEVNQDDGGIRCHARWGDTDYGAVWANGDPNCGESVTRPETNANALVPMHPASYANPALFAAFIKARDIVAANAA
ncbi:MAG: hypothetical protein ACYC96_09815 [Fimbriimonadaceae bacterium]